MPWAKNRVARTVRGADAAGDCEHDRATRASPTPHTQLPSFARLGGRGRRLTWSEATQALFGIVQGGMDRQLRKESAERTIEIGFPGYAIGGLSVGEPRSLTREVVESTIEHLPADKPRYLMGVGTPEEIVEYAKLGVDMMDCVLPTRAARHGLLFTSEGKISIKQARYAGDELRSTQIVGAGCAIATPGLISASLCCERGLGAGLKYHSQSELLP